MKKIVVLLFTLLLPFSVSAQLKLETKKYVVSDFTQKTMKVVLTGNSMLDAYIRECVQKVWNISPYEICDFKNFEQNMTSENNYFMIVTDARNRKETVPGISMISIYKGKSNAEKGNVSSMYEVVSIPFCSVENPEGRCMEFLPILISVLQDQVLMFMNTDINPTCDIRVKSEIALKKKWDRRCAICEDDFAEKPGLSQRAILKGDNIDVVTGDELTDIIQKHTPSTLIGYVVAPTVPANGSKCFCMLFDSMTWEIYYYSSHKLGIKTPKGFGSSEIKAITSHK